MASNVYYITLARELVGYAIKVVAESEYQVRCMAKARYGELWCSVYTELPEGTKVIGHTAYPTDYPIKPEQKGA